MTISRIRPARIEDAGDIAKVQVETWLDVYAGIIPDGYILSLNIENRCRQWLAALSEKQRSQEIFVAQDAGGSVVGFSSAGPGRKNDQPAGHKFDAEIYTLYVAPDFQGFGLGRQLINSMLAALRHRGCRDAFLWVISANPARFFYEAMGGQIVGERIERFADTDLAEIAYGWKDLVIDD
jgi:ribosomal protein S18 acetylase RimI-like enzyme